MTVTMSAMRVRIHITPGQRRALTTVLDRSPDDLVRVADFTATFDMANPIGWLEARMAEWPRAEFPRASLHGVARKLSAAIRSQVQPDPATPDATEPTGQAQPDLIPAILRRAADHLSARRTVSMSAVKAIVAAVEEFVPEEEARRGLPMRAIRAVVARLHLTASPSVLATFAWWDQDTGRAEVIEALDATAAALSEGGTQ